MITIEKSRDVLSSVERVWDIVSDRDKDEKYWTALRDVKVLSKDGNTIEREASAGPGAFSHTSKQTLVLDPKKSIKPTMTGAPMTGERNLVLVPMSKYNTWIDVSWSFQVTDVPGFVLNLVKGQISNAAEGALKRIKKAPEEEGFQNTTGESAS